MYLSYLKEQRAWELLEKRNLFLALMLVKQNLDIMYKSYPCPEMLFHHFPNCCNWGVVPLPSLPSFLNILAFLRLISWSPISCLRWGSCPTAAQWGHEELSLSSTSGFCRGVVFSLFNFASGSLWISALWGDCHDLLTCAAQRGLWIHENNKVLWNKMDWINTC